MILLSILAPLDAGASVNVSIIALYKQNTYGPFRYLIYFAASDTHIFDTLIHSAFTE